MKDYKENKSNLSETFCNEVYSVVREIPAGSVTTYGDIAALLGMPQYSRMVGRALRQVPAGLNLPCHRVVNAIGRLVPGWDEQRRLLDAEGVSFRQAHYTYINPYKRVSINRPAHCHPSTCEA